MGGDWTPCLQLHKLSSVKSEEQLEEVLTLLWKTRKTGLRNLEKSFLQSLLDLSSAAELDLVLVCLRSIIRKIIHESFAGPDILKLFPPDLPVDVQSMLVKLLQKYQNQWKDEHELSREQDYSISQFDTCMEGGCASILAQSKESLLQQQLLVNADASDNQGVMPRLKSMAWTLENQNTTCADRTAIVSLTLQDTTKSPPSEIEVKFRLTQDMLEVVIRSLAYITEKLSQHDKSSSEPLQKKLRQCLISSQN